MDLKIGNDWDELLSAETDKPYFGQLKSFVESEYAKYTVYPPRSLIFAALRYVPYSEVRVVIVGQDPYINPGQANGLAFAVNKGVKLPPSLVNIYKELSSDIGADMSGHERRERRSYGLGETWRTAAQRDAYGAGGSV